MKLFAGMTLALVAILFAAQSAVAQEWSQPWARERIDKSPRHREWVTVKHDNRSVDVLVVYPESKEKRPVVLVIHEIFGLSDWAQELADEVAAAGYIAVAPDLLTGMAPNGGRTKDFPQGTVTEAVSKLNPDQVTADLNASSDYGLKLPSSNGKLFVMGFCWGGGQTFRFATNRVDLSAAFVFLWASATQRRDVAHQSPRLWLLRRQRCAYRCHHSRYHRRNESRRENVRPGHL